MLVAGGTLRQQLDDAVTLIGALREENERLREETDELRTQNGELHDRIMHLESQMARDSRNSSLPPSHDKIEARQSRAERRKTARAAQRRQGKQPGDAGKHLQRREPDRFVAHEPVVCRCCGADLAGAEIVGEVRRQVIDMPPVVPVVTEHVAQRRRCACGVETTAEFPPEATAPVVWGPEVRAFAVYLMDRQHLPVERTAELLRNLLGADVSTGWLCQVKLEAAHKLAPNVSELKQRFFDEPVVHADETGTRVKTVKHWMHTLTTNLLTLIAVHPKRGADALRDIGVLPEYTGVIVHDGWTPYELFVAATHAQCGAHVLRHLFDVGSTPAFELWTDQITRALLAAKKASEEAAATGLAAVPTTIAEIIRRDYHDALDVAFVLLPDGAPPPKRHKGGWSVAQRKAWNLATRLRRDEGQVLRLLDDTRVPFDNNAAERSLRMIKLHDKVSGSFNSYEGAQAFADVRSYLQTADKHGENLIGVLHRLFTEGPWLPPLPAGGT